MSGFERCRNAALALMMCTACSNSIMQVGSQYAASKVIGAGGGTLTVTAAEDPTIAGTSITVPAGALSAATNIQIGRTSKSVVSSGALGPVIDFEPSPTTFAKPVTMSIPANLAAGFSASRVGVMAVEANGSSSDITAVTVTASAVATGANSLATFQTSSFTDYGAHDEGASDLDGGCTPSCGGDATCGSSDGCGGTCNANCSDGGCTPSCGGDAACGSSDGCGGTCNANCVVDGGPGCSACSDGGGATVCCGNSCVDTSSDLNHCGSCDMDCTVVGAGLSDLSCVRGQCYCGTEGADLGIICPDGTCSTLTSDPNNCGSCGNVCQSPAVDCVNAGCACPDGESLCGQPDAGTPLFCINTIDDASNCGACGNDCGTSYGSNSGCLLGACTCDPGTTFLCGEPGAAGTACLADGSACDAGSCYQDCEDYGGCTTVCDGGATSPDYDGGSDGSPDGGSGPSYDGGGGY